MKDKPGVHLEKRRTETVQRDVNKTSDNLGDAIYSKSAKRLQENLRKGEIKY